jgi:hypothetical protein
LVPSKRSCPRRICFTGIRFESGLAIFATRYGHVVTVQADANQMEATHEIYDLRHALLTERVSACLIESLGQGTTPVQGGVNVVGDRFVSGKIRRALSRDDGRDLSSCFTALSARCSWP